MERDVLDSRKRIDFHTAKAQYHTPPEKTIILYEAAWDFVTAKYRKSKTPSL